MPQSHTNSFTPVHINYFNGDNLNNLSPLIENPRKLRKLKKLKKPKKLRKLFYKYSIVLDNPIERGSFLVRRALYKVFERPPVDRQILPLVYTTPLRIYREIQTYGRKVFEQHWDRVNNLGVNVLSCPVLTFIDKFGIYRNARRLVIGMYQSPTGLSYNNNSKRTRNANIFPIVLGPHAANFDTVVNTIRCLIPLEKGVIIEIYSKLIIVSIFTICYTSDMPQ